VEVQVPGVDPELVRELAICQVLLVARAQGLENTKPERVPERFQLVGSLECEHVEESSGGGGRRHPAIFARWP